MPRSACIWYVTTRVGQERPHSAPSCSTSAVSAASTSVITPGMDAGVKVAALSALLGATPRGIDLICSAYTRTAVATDGVFASRRRESRSERHASGCLREASSRSRAVGDDRACVCAVSQLLSATSPRYPVGAWNLHALSPLVITLSRMEDRPNHDGKRILHEVKCRGCGMLFQHHFVTVDYCNDDCRLRYRAAAKSGFCCICGARQSTALTFLFSPEDSRVQEEELLVFASKHRSCRRELLEEEGQVLSCSCKKCCAADGTPFVPRTPWKTSSGRSSNYVKHAETVFDRDGYMCQICDLTTLSATRPSDEMHPVLDHVDQVRDGGSDEIDNLRTAHRWCNTAREHRVWGDDRTVKMSAQARFADRSGTAGCRSDFHPQDGTRARVPE